MRNARWFSVVLAGSLAFSVLGCSHRAASSGKATVATAPAETDPVHVAALKRWEGFKFGMFIHWGPYSVASVEASWPIMRPRPKWQISEAQYVHLYQKFDPTQFRPQAWVQLARQAGMRYMVFTTKHHDGFCMWNTALTDYNIMHTPYGKDVVGQLTTAAHAAKMPIGLYYSPPDMHNPDFRDTSKPVKDTWHGDPASPNWPKYLNYMQGQLHELLTNYGPVELVWFDGLDHQGKYDGQRFADEIHQLQPACLMNNRLGVPGDYETPEQFIPAGVPTRAAHIQGINREQHAGVSKTAPPPSQFQPWETCMTINDTWAYNKNDHHYKSVQTLVRDLVDVASKGGNFLLDVGPTPEGRIQPEFVSRLCGIGRWLHVNGDSIYGTTYGPLQNLGFGRTTAKGNAVYVHVFDWPRDGRLVLNGLPGAVASVRLLANHHALAYRQQGDALAIRVPAAAPDRIDTVIEVTGAR